VTKRAILIAMIIAAFGFVRAQDVIQSKDFDYTSYGQMIYWNEFNHKENFYNASTYAFQKVKTGRESMNDIYKRTYKQLIQAVFSI
jgi:hypothetical protein